MKRSHFSPLTRKALADVTRRKGRTLLVVVGIVVGVFGLTAINVSAGALAAAFAFSADQRVTPEISFDVQSVNPAGVPAPEAQPNVRAVQVSTRYSTRWQI